MGRNNKKLRDVLEEEYVVCCYCGARIKVPHKQHKSRHNEDPEIWHHNGCCTWPGKNERW